MALPPLELFSLKEGAALLPGGSFRFYGASGPVCRGRRRFVTAGEEFDTYPFTSPLNSGTVHSVRSRISHTGLDPIGECRADSESGCESRVAHEMEVHK